MKKKTGKRSRPATWADVTHARRDGAERMLIMAIYTMVDKCGATIDDIHALAEGVKYVADAMCDGYLNIKDMRTVLKDEYDLEIKLD